MLLSLIMPVYNQPLVIRALDSIPIRDDIELVVVDDCSTDDTLNKVIEWKNSHQLKMTIIHNNKNMGVGYSENEAREFVTGDWVQRLDSDDYLLTQNLCKLLDKLSNDNLYDMYDIIYHDMEVNNGSAFTINTPTYFSDAGATKMIKTSLWRTIEMENLRQGEDARFATAFWKLNPRALFYHDAMIYHYNFPREGSLSWNWRHGISNEVK